MSQPLCLSKGTVLVVSQGCDGVGVEIVKHLAQLEDYPLLIVGNTEEDREAIDNMHAKRFMEMTEAMTKASVLATIDSLKPIKSGQESRRDRRAKERAEKKRK